MCNTVLFLSNEPNIGLYVPFLALTGGLISRND